MRNSQNYGKNIAHMFYLVLENSKIRTDALMHFKDNKVVTTSHYQPLHSSIAGKEFGFSKCEFNNSIAFSERILRLPIYIGLEDKKIEQIIQLLRQITTK
jgi:dTDP-4-amino-4,6-dideoxygalactose transaminase